MCNRYKYIHKRNEIHHTDKVSSPPRLLKTPGGSDRITLDLRSLKQKSNFMNIMNKLRIIATMGIFKEQ